MRSARHFYFGLGAALMLVAACFLPVMSKNGISVNAFRPELGVYGGFWLLGIALTGGISSFFPLLWAVRLSLAFYLIAFLTGLNYWWTGWKMDAAAVGAPVIAFVALAGAVTAWLRLRQRA